MTEEQIRELIPKAILEFLSKAAMVINTDAEASQSAMEDLEGELGKCAEERNLLNSKIALLKEEIDLLNKEANLNAKDEILQFPGVARDDVLKIAESKVKEQGTQEFISGEIKPKNNKQRRRLELRLEKAFYFSILCFQSFHEFVDEAKRVGCIDAEMEKKLREWANSSLKISFNKNPEVGQDAMERQSEDA